MFLRVLFLAAYDPTASQVTPVQFRNSLGLDALCLTADIQSVDGGVYRTAQGSGSEVFAIPVPVSNAIFNLTGHAGLCRTTLTTLRHLFRNGGSVVDVWSLQLRVLQSMQSFIWAADAPRSRHRGQLIVRGAFIRGRWKRGSQIFTDLLILLRIPTSKERKIET